MFLETPQIPWSSLRSAVQADDTALSTFDYDSWPSFGTLTLDATNRLRFVNGCEIAFYGTDAENEDATFKLYGRRSTNGPIVLLLSGTIVLGSQLVTKDPISKVVKTAYWADTIIINGGILQEAASILDNANNRIAILRVDLRGFKDLFCEVDLDGGSNAMAEFNAIISGA